MVVSVRWPGSQTGMLSGIWIETDEVNSGFGFGYPGFVQMFDVCPSPAEQARQMARQFQADAVPTFDDDHYDNRVVVNLRNHWNEIRTAMNTVLLEGLAIEKVTILKGVVQAHPPVDQHHHCPFCYPKEPT